MTKMTIPDEIKARVDARQCLEFYGVPIDRRGFAKCPFHQGDNTGSLKVYDGDKGWHCFACSAGNSVIDFVMLYFGLPFQAAQEKLNADFNLGLPIGETLTPAQRAKIAADARALREATKERERRRSALAEAVDRALTAYVLAEKANSVIQSEMLSDDDVNPREVKIKGNGRTLAHIDAAWYNLCEAESNLSEFLTSSRAGKQEKR